MIESGFIKLGGKNPESKWFSRRQSILNYISFPLVWGAKKHNSSYLYRAYMEYLNWFQVLSRKLGYLRHINICNGKEFLENINRVKYIKITIWRTQCSRFNWDIFYSKKKNEKCCQLSHFIVSNVKYE